MDEGIVYDEAMADFIPSDVGYACVNERRGGGCIVSLGSGP